MEKSTQFDEDISLEIIRKNSMRNTHDQQQQHSPKRSGFREFIQQRTWLNSSVQGR